MTIYPLLPQVFGTGAVTQLPEIDFFQYAKNQLPSVYQNAPDFMQVVMAISANKQQLYDIIRSLVNVFNLNDTGNTTFPPAPSAVPSGYLDPDPNNVGQFLPIFAQMIASVFGAPYDAGAASLDIINATQNVVNFINSRGQPQAFFNYFNLNGLAGNFTNANVIEDGNATIFFDVPIENNPALKPNPFDQFIFDMNKLKGAGIKIRVQSTPPPFFQYGALPSAGPPYVAPGNLGYGVLQPSGVVAFGGFYSPSFPI